MRFRTETGSLPSSTESDPLSGVRMPVIMRRVVVLPAPFGPRNPYIIPPGTSSESWSTAVWGPKRLVTPSSLMALLMIASPR